MKEEVEALNAIELLEMIFIYLAEVSSRRAFDEVIEVLADMGKALSGADRCSIWIVSEDRKWLQTKVAQGIEPLTIPIDSGIVGSSVTSGTRYIIDDVYKDERFNKEIDNETGYRTNSMMVIPMYDNNENVIGAFQVINRKGNGGVFDSRDMERLTLAATYAAETIVAAQLTKEIEETQKEVVFTMGAIGESRSKETGNHVKRVAEYSKLLALHYGLDTKEAELLKEASPMHDIGKVAIPDSILNKPGRFNAQEKAVMQRHAELGYNILKNSKRRLLQAAAIVAYEHHEKWDGSGYPRGLKGEEIHIYGRITALADVFDALGSDRVYKKAWSDERIFALLEEERGKHFDPKLVDIFFQNKADFFAIRDQFRDVFAENKEQIEDATITILGAYGTKAKGFATTSFLLNKTTVIDAGNLLEALGESSVDLEGIWLTHAHLDHIVDIAHIIDNYFQKRKKTVTIYATATTIEALKKHFLNDIIWPDFSKIRLENGNFVVKYQEIVLAKEYKIAEDETIRAFQNDHTDGSCGYIFKKGERAVLISSDTYSLDGVITELERDDSIKAAVIECSFPSDMEQLATQSKHLTPKLLFSMLAKSEREDLKLYINHIKPEFIFKIVDELEKYGQKYKPTLLKDGDFINF